MNTSQNLPYPDPIHPIVVHFVIAMVCFSFFCDVIGYLAQKHRLFEVSFWNLFVATIAIFLAIFFGELEAGLASPLRVAKPVLDLHTIMGWSLSALIVTVTTWRFALRNRNPLRVSPAYLGVATVLVSLVCFQTYLGSQLVWVYGLHVEPVVRMLKRGMIP